MKITFAAKDRSYVLLTLSDCYNYSFTILFCNTLLQILPQYMTCISMSSSSSYQEKF